uniref:Bowman-Birk inhibitor 4 n=1 Tax=Selaginella moellendorffii TaxID=88036 RepID=A0A1V0PLJ2_SELML|nr:Bowman-Birk inhibitor 4 [Selaginella moellendorffii]
MVCRPNSHCCPGSKRCSKAGQFCGRCTRSFPPTCFCDAPDPKRCSAASQCCSDADCLNGGSCSLCTRSIPPICRCFKPGKAKLKL